MKPIIKPWEHLPAAGTFIPVDTPQLAADDFRRLSACSSVAVPFQPGQNDTDSGVKNAIGGEHTNIREASSTP